MHDVSREAVLDSGTSPAGHTDSAISERIEHYWEFINPLMAVVLIIMAWVREASDPASIYLALAACVLSGYPIVRNSVVSTLTNRKLNAEVLVTCALIAAIWVGEYIAGAIVVLMMNVGELLEDITIAKTGQAIRALMKLEADTARVIRNGREFEVDISEVQHGDIVLVKPGEQIPIDGKVIGGSGEVNQAPITGESALIHKEPGDDVFGGTLNQLGALKIEVARVGSETIISKIIDLVHRAQAEKPPIERVADRFASWFTPTMLLLSLLVWLVTDEILRAVTVLVVACPCALVIATPTAVVAGIGNAARKGILIKSAAVLEIIGKLTTFVFDKTGTLTYGLPSVKTIKPFQGVSKQELLTAAGTTERHSEHPLAAAILRYCQEQEIWPYEPDHIEVIVGRGIIATKGGNTFAVGNERLMTERGISMSSEGSLFMQEMTQSGQTAVFVAQGETLMGGIGISDRIRSDVQSTIQDLRKIGIRKILMLTGDNRKVAHTISEGSGLDDVVAELLPQDKLTYIQKLRQKGERVAMVGDGINDAPSLAEADVGIAMGVMGTDAAIEAADIALTSDDLKKTSEAIALSRKTVAIIKQSIFASIAINTVALVLASTGDIGPIAGAIIHNIGSLMVVGNSSRLIGYRYKT